MFFFTSFVPMAETLFNITWKNINLTAKTHAYWKLAVMVHWVWNFYLNGIQINFNYTNGYFTRKKTHCLWMSFGSYSLCKYLHHTHDISISVCTSIQLDCNLIWINNIKFIWNTATSSICIEENSIKVTISIE